jgi:endonuclease/exonuclease/phosphatase family metal-dependent hydrolase
LPVLQKRWLAMEDDILIALVEIDATEPLGRPIVLYLIDLPSDPRLPRADVARKIRSFLDEVEDDTPPPDAAVGDFNITRGSAALSMAMPGLHHAFNDGGHGYGASFHERLPLYHIDHILLADTLRCTRYDLIDAGLGRHRAQAAWIVSTATAASR